MPSMTSCFILPEAALDKQQLFPSPVPGSEVWSAGNPSEHCTSNGHGVYDRRPPLPEEALLGGQMEVQCYGKLDLVVHCGEGEGVRVTLDNVAVVPTFPLENVISILQISEHGHGVTMGPHGVSAFNGQLRFVRGSTGNYVQATRVAPGGAPAQ